MWPRIFAGETRPPAAPGHAHGPDGDHAQGRAHRVDDGHADAAHRPVGEQGLEFDQAPDPIGVEN